jgi:hypothetical protein
VVMFATVFDLLGAWWSARRSCCRRGECALLLPV